MSSKKGKNAKSGSGVPPTVSSATTSSGRTQSGEDLQQQRSAVGEVVGTGTVIRTVTRGGSPNSEGLEPSTGRTNEIASISSNEDETQVSNEDQGRSQLDDRDPVSGDESPLRDEDDPGMELPRSPNFQVKLMSRTPGKLVLHDFESWQELREYLEDLEDGLCETLVQNVANQMEKGGIITKSLLEQMLGDILPPDEYGVKCMLSSRVVAHLMGYARHKVPTIVVQQPKERVVESSRDMTPKMTELEKFLKRIRDEDEKNFRNLLADHDDIWEFLLMVPRYLAKYGDDTGKFWHPFLVNFAHKVAKHPGKLEKLLNALERVKPREKERWTNVCIDFLVIWSRLPESELLPSLSQVRLTVRNHKNDDLESYLQKVSQVYSILGTKFTKSPWEMNLMVYQNMPKKVRTVIDGFKTSEPKWLTETEKPGRTNEFIARITGACDTFKMDLMRDLPFENESVMQTLREMMDLGSEDKNKIGHHRERPDDNKGLPETKKFKVSVTGGKKEGRGPPRVREKPRDDKCHFCKKPGHFKKDCPAAKGHFSSEGKGGGNPKTNKNVSSKYSSREYSSKQCNKLFQRRFVRPKIAHFKKMAIHGDKEAVVFTSLVAINGRVHEGVCDSYATHSMVNKAFVNRFKLGPLYHVDDMEVKLGNGKTVIPDCVEVLVQDTKGASKKHILYCIDHVSTEPEMVIGLDLFRFLGVRFDHNRRVFVGSRFWDNLTITDEAEARKFVTAPKSTEMADEMKEILKLEIDLNQRVSGFSPVGKVKIPCTKKKNIRQRTLPIALEAQVAQKVKEWYTVTDGKQVIEDSTCVEHSLPLVVVRKKNGKIRLCLDLRFVNENTPYDVNTNQTIPKIKNIKQMAMKYKYFSVLDVVDAFNSLELEEGSRDFTTFIVNGRRYRFRGVPFGLHFLPAHFQMVMEKLFVKLPYVNPYLDDIVVGASSKEELVDRLREVINILSENKFKVNMEKSVFAAEEVHILGSIVSNGEIRMDKEKLLNFHFEVPKRGKDIERICGFGQFFADHIPLYATAVSWLQARKKRRKLTDLEIEKAAAEVENLRRLLYEGIPLAQYDPSLPICLATDASRDGISGVLFQDVPNNDLVSGKVKKPMRNKPFESCEDLESFRPTRVDLGLVDQPTEGIRVSNTIFAKESLDEIEFIGNQPMGVTDVLSDAHHKRQGHGEDKRPKERSVHRRYVGFFSKCLKDAETRYPVTKLECLAVVKSVQYFHEFLYGRQFKLLTDHQPLLALFRSENQLLTNTVQQWLDILMEYSFEIEYIPGARNELPDKLSRLYKEREAGNSSPDQPSSLALGSAMQMTVRMRDLSNKKSLRDSEKSLRESLIKEAHGEGHFGVPTVVEKILEKGYTWSSIREDAAKFAARCPQCRKFDLKRGFHPMFSETHILPLERVSVDVVGKIPSSNSGHNRILVMVDSATKFVWLRSLIGKKSINVAREMFLIFCQWGFPKEINFDGGSEFAGKVSKLLKALHIEYKKGAAYNPHSTGLVEAHAKIVFQSLRKISDDLGKRANWNDVVIPMMFELNNRFASITKSTPFSLFYGRPGGFELSKSLDKVDKQVPEEAEMKAYWDEILSHVYPAIFRIVEDRREKVREYYDTRHHGKLNQFAMNDLVMLETPSRSKNGMRKDKLEPSYVGPFMVVRAWKDGMNYDLMEIETGKRRDFRHIPTNRLKIAAHPVLIYSQRRGEKEDQIDYLMEWDSGEIYWIPEESCPLDMLEKYYESKGLPLPSRISKRYEMSDSEDPEVSEHSSEDDVGSQHDQDSDFGTAVVGEGPSDVDD